MESYFLRADEIRFDTCDAAIVVVGAKVGTIAQKIAKRKIVSFDEYCSNLLLMREHTAGKIHKKTCKAPEK